MLKMSEEKETPKEEPKEEAKEKPKADTEDDSDEKSKEETEVPPADVEKVLKEKKNEFDKDAWMPRTQLGKKVKSGEITDLSEILDKGLKILEPGIVDALLPGLESDLLLIGQSKGKFGGGQRRVFKQTQKKTREGNKPHFATIAIIGNKNGFVGVGYGKSKETVPAREKAIRQAKLNIIKIRRGAGSWESDSREPTSIPYAVSGKCSGVSVKLLPAPKGTGLCIEAECAKILELAGIKDVRSKTLKRKTKLNLIKACFKALRQLSQTKLMGDHKTAMGIVEGAVEGEKTELQEAAKFAEETAEKKEKEDGNTSSK